MKKAFYIGLVAGGLLGVVVALSMDILLGKSLGGGWNESVANDLNNLFSTNLPQNHVLVIMGVIVAVGIIAAFGAFIGGVSFVIIAHIFTLLTKER